MRKALDSSLGPVHLVGIGGSGMSGIARILLARGFQVSGSDTRETQEIHALRALGARVAVGHAAVNLLQFGIPASVIITSTAIPLDNPELTEAHTMLCEVIHRSEALASLLIGRKSLAVAGTHGKTTTTSMTAVALQSLGLDPSYAIGAGLGSAGSNAHHGNGDFFVIEADESDKSFLAYSPDSAIITNIEADHMDQFTSLAEIDNSFLEFAHSVSESLVLCGDDAGVQRLLSKLDRKVVSYGKTATNDLVISEVHPVNAGSIFTANLRGRKLGSFTLQVPGVHNVLNAAAVIAMSAEYGLSMEGVRKGLAEFAGARRRFDIRGTVSKVTVVDDYAHHPTEIVATLKAAREVAPRGRIIAIFQPHRFTRLQAFMGEFASALASADEVAIMDVYGAGESALPGVSGMRLAALIPGATFLPSFLDVSEWAAKIAQPGDYVFTLGAGDVTLLGPAILEQLAVVAKS
ncbi:MAG: UDP-N-acetylmuramate--L-alanine ligase [Actinobacteria bacterium]|uniref:UDP-N-acetylmuramate--L-alanine ligase n=1 Tax=freshwater metagenome TaxID=449393 RepID=A0A6J7TPE8_9ZZZZ|nr:UDP-N-acetylmuramate--L-alanine ligase [Actinomycetota bacterium]MSY27457.1 UDP-N-acetylmuramate--L-alanine ligase [Actinomycetota bacterium]MSZ87059.1 UDP-N-acetylmuramate--L-alanine ligase [Actinomycetota bacterium]MTB14659.1 UDP-N-acetylmuramate--L-alanine ligase [Actinomycetota bacterium]MTB25472.1 UDP-N-acetylmuramate--L-alanine ligase [Actinomycetota bacterium]